MRTVTLEVREPTESMADFARVGRAGKSERSVKAVHSDVTALLDAGVLDRADGRGIVFPYEAVKVEFLLQAA